MIPAALLAIGSALGFGVAGVLLRRGLEYTGPVSAAVVSVSVTTALIWAITVVTTPLDRLLTWRIWPFLVAGLVAPGLARLFFFMGVDRIGVARAFSLMAGAPLFAVVLAIAFLGERPGPLLLVGAMAIVTGGVLLARRSHEEKPWRRRDMILPLLGALGFAVRDNLSRWGFREYGDALTAAAAATVTSLAMMWLVAGVRRAKLDLPGVALVLLVSSGLFEGVAYLTMWRALAIGDVSVVSPLVNSHSIVAIALSAIFLRDLERVTWRIALAAALIVSGVALVMRGA
jgi:drug/metabolite transporter (DMT)-like permease